MAVAANSCIECLGSALPPLCRGSLHPHPSCLVGNEAQRPCRPPPHGTLSVLYGSPIQDGGKARTPPTFWISLFSSNLGSEVQNTETLPQIHRQHW